MTFKEWVTNPSGKGSAVMSTKQMYRDLYDKKLNLLVLKEGNDFKYTLYKSKDERAFYIHIKIPSEVVSKFYYDVVIMFYTINPAYAVGTTLNHYDMKVFSNSPDFMFTHAHAYLKQGLLFEDMSSKLPKESLRNVAKERNPKDEIGYIKSIYFTYMIMLQRNLFGKVSYRTAKIYNKKEVLNNVMACEEKAQLRQSEESKMKAEKRREKDLERRKENEQRNVGKTVGQSTHIASSKKVGTVPVSKKAKYVSRVPKK